MCVLKYLHFQIDEYLDQIKDHPSAAAGHPVLLSLSLILVLVVSERGYSKHSKQ